MSLPRISIVRRTEDIPKWLPLVTTLGAVVLAFLIGAIILASIGANPLYIYSYFFRGSIWQKLAYLLSCMSNFVRCLGGEQNGKL